MLEINCSNVEVKSFPIAIVVSRFNKSVTEQLLQSTLSRLEECGFDSSDISIVHVPGACEIPIVLKKLAEKSTHRALIALGAVIRGETTHYDYVCEQVSQGCQTISLDYNLPVVFGVLTTESCEQAFARAGGEHSDKGREAVDCAIEMVLVLEKLQAGKNQ